MELTQNERELLAILKHINSHQGEVDRLIRKLLKENTASEVAHLTGFSKEAVKEIHAQKKIQTRQPKLPKQVTEKPAEKMTSSERIAERIIGDTKKFFAVDGKLARQEDLIKHFGASASTIRKAVGHLADDKKVEPINHFNRRLGYKICV